MSKIILAEQASAPSTPSAGKVAVYANNATLPALCWKDDAGNVNVAPGILTGTWTPALAFAGSSTGITYSTQTGYYTKVGVLVNIAFDIVLTNKGTFSASDAATITGVPFAPVGSIVYGGHAHYVATISGLSGPPFGYLTSTTITLLYYSSGIASLVYSQFANTSRLSMNITYRASS